MDENSDKLQKIRNPFEIVNKTFSKLYSPSEQLAVDKVIVLLRGRVISRQYRPHAETHKFWHQNVQNT